MTTTNALRFLDHQARLCRDRDAHEALCLLLPAMLRAFELEPMEEMEAAAFRYEFKEVLANLPFRDDTDRASARSPFLLHLSKTV
jgi:hypothetical protein